MHTLQPDSGDEIATTTTTTTTDADTSTTRAAEKDAATSEGQRAASEQQGELGAEQGQAREVGGPRAESSLYLGGGSRRRLLLIALDGAAPELALGAWHADLRALAAIGERGVRGRLQSSVPWSSPNAWLSLFSGLDAGQLGMYAGEQRPNYTYATPAPLDSRALRVPRLWDLLGRADCYVGVVGAPLTYPTTPLNGHLVNDSSGNLAAYPASFARQLAGWLADDPAEPVTQGDALDRLIGAAYARAERRFRLARRMLARESYDAFVLYDDGIATVQRALWHTLDVTHLRYVPNHPFAAAIGAFYRFIDEQIGALLELIDSDTAVAIVSACGAQALDGELALNDWLIGEGLLRLREQPASPGPLAPELIDWPATRAWAGANGTLFLNRAGREPQGTVAHEQADALLGQLAERIAALRPPLAQALQAPAFVAYRPAALYAGTQGVAPDLQVIGELPGWRTNAEAGHASPWRSAPASALDAAYESPRGMLLLYDPRNPGGGRELAGATIYDVLPTLLALFDLPAPARARGHALLELSA